MISCLTAIYEGDGIIRLLNVPPELVPYQQLQISIVEPELEFDWGEPYNPSAAAVWASMGIVEIQDRAEAEWIAFSPEASEWNLAFNETADESGS